MSQDTNNDKASNPGMWAELMAGPMGLKSLTIEQIEQSIVRSLAKLLCDSGPLEIKVSVSTLTFPKMQFGEQAALALSTSIKRPKKQESEQEAVRDDITAESANPDWAQIMAPPKALRSLSVAQVENALAQGFIESIAAESPLEIRVSVSRLAFEDVHFVEKAALELTASTSYKRDPSIPF